MQSRNPETPSAFPAPPAAPPMRTLRRAGSMFSDRAGPIALPVMASGSTGVNLLLSPDGVLTLFRTLRHRDDPQLPLKEHMACPRCLQTLVRGTDRTISGALAGSSLPRQHGHFNLPAFMVEKTAMRPLAPAECRHWPTRCR